MKQLLEGLFIKKATLTKENNEYSLSTVCSCGKKITFNNEDIFKAHTVVEGEYGKWTELITTEFLEDILTNDGICYITEGITLQDGNIPGFHPAPPSIHLIFKNDLEVLN